MKIALLLFVLLSIGQNMLSQSGYANRQFTNDLFQVDEYIKRQNSGIDFKDVSSYTGSPYNNPKFLAGNIYKNNELWATDIAIRYNAMADEMEIKESLNSDDDARVLTKSPDVYVKIINDIYIFAPYKGGIEGGGYFQVLYEGKKIDFYKKPKKKFSPEKKATSSITRDTPANFKDEPIFYIIDKKGKFYELPESRSKKLKVFGDNKDAIKDFVKNYNLDLNNENDLLKVIKHYDTF